MGWMVLYEYHVSLGRCRCGFLSPPGINTGLNSSLGVVKCDLLLVQKVYAVVDDDGAPGLNIFFCGIALVN